MSFRTADQKTSKVVSTGSETLDKLLGGGLEAGLMHLFYGDKVLRDDVLQIAVSAQQSEDKGGLGAPVIIIDSNNIMDVATLADYCLWKNLEPEDVMDRVFISRAFNSSQTYDLVTNKLEEFFEQVPARTLIVPGLADIYHREGITQEGTRQITHMAHRLQAFTLQKGVVTVITASLSESNSKLPLGGRALTSCCQVHILVDESKAYVKYNLAKHPVHPPRRKSRMKSPMFGTTLPLEHFLDE
jgi:RecA/RadA recombinase